MIKTKEMPILPPESLLVSPCKPIPAGTTGEETVKGYIVNTSCITQYEVTLQSVRDWKVTILKLYEDKKK